MSEEPTATGGASSGHPLQLDGRVAVVTGGSQGIGFGLARGLVRGGARVALWARTQDTLEAASEQLNLLRPNSVRTVCCDVRYEQQIADALQTTLDAFGRVDALFANAGICDNRAFLDSSIEHYRRQHAVNVEGTLHSFRAAARQMVEQGDGGSLVAVSSIAAKVGWPHMAEYSATKGALISLVRALAVELGGHGIRVNALLPGVFQTPGTASLESLEQHYRGQVPVGRIGDPRDVESAAVFFASATSNYLTGTALRLDGGLSLAAR